MKIIILAAGKGQRFRDAGFFFPKPLIQVNGISMVEHIYKVAMSVVHPDDVIILGTRDVHDYTEYKGVGLHQNLVPVDVIQPGPAMSVLLCGGLIQMEEPVILLDCDNMYNNWRVILDSIKDTLRAKNELASVVTTTHIPGVNRLKYSTVFINSSGYIQNIEEKVDQGSDHVCTGIYGFKEWKDFVSGVGYYIARWGIRDGKEIYISDVVSQLLEEGKEVIAQQVRQEDWIPLGTPSDFLAAMERYEHE